MIDMMDGQLKFDIARNAVRTLIDKLPPNSELALRVYGHRKNFVGSGVRSGYRTEDPDGATR